MSRRTTWLMMLATTTGLVSSSLCSATSLSRRARTAGSTSMVNGVAAGTEIMVKPEILNAAGK
jgi:hypothetical protein